MNRNLIFGKSAPIGATLIDGGVNFSLFSRTATSVELLLFDREDDPQPTRIIRFDSPFNRTYQYWHAFVPGIRCGQIYAYRVDGPFNPKRGLRFEAEKILLDPYGKGVVVPAAYDRQLARQPGDNCASAMKSVVVDTTKLFSIVPPFKTNWKDGMRRMVAAKHPDWLV